MDKVSPEHKSRLVSADIAERFSHVGRDEYRETVSISLCKLVLRSAENDFLRYRWSE